MLLFVSRLGVGMMVLDMAWRTYPSLFVVHLSAASRVVVVVVVPGGVLGVVMSL